MYGLSCIPVCQLSVPGACKVHELHRVVDVHTDTLLQSCHNVCGQLAQKEQNAPALLPSGPCNLYQIIQSCYYICVYCIHTSMQ